MEVLTQKRPRSEDTGCEHTRRANGNGANLHVSSQFSGQLSKMQKQWTVESFDRRSRFWVSARLDLGEPSKIREELTTVPCSGDSGEHFGGISAPTVTGNFSDAAAIRLRRFRWRATAQGLGLGKFIKSGF
ncbi:cytokinin receptor CRE1b [Corchorus olitorius]|uniref:Cytokinin receptor CRE1b n=1 Tax=Corchorus olitorius TaxID=93759 RepID=A0A1R3HMB4_9ROSI|nr:cytokinin receptor CRE1b [Corchorus olitorius]